MSKKENARSAELLSLLADSTGLINSAEAEKQLGKNFIIFINNFPREGMFIVGGDVLGGGSSSPCGLFQTAFVGATRNDIDRIGEFIQSLRMEIKSIYHEKDFHASLLAKRLSRFLYHNHYSAIGTPKVLVEFMMLDIKGNLTRIRYNGEREFINVHDSKEKIFLAGGYNKTFRAKLLKAMQSLVKTKTKSKKKFEEIGNRISKELKISFMACYRISFGKT